MTETLKHKEAFEHYYASGATRSLRYTAGVQGVSIKSIGAWSREFDWPSRVEQRDMQNAKRLQKATDDTVVAVKAKYRKIVQAAIGKFVQGLQTDAIAVETVTDLERLIKLDLLLMGEATDKTEHAHSLEERFDFDALSDNELRERMADALHRLAHGSLSPLP
jgi:hypothetical protein